MTRVSCDCAVFQLVYYLRRASQQHKKLDIIIPQENLVELNDLLHKHAVGGMSFYDIKGRCKAKQMPVKVGRGVTMYVPEFGQCTKVKVLVPEDVAKKRINGALKIFGPGGTSIGKIFVYEVSGSHGIGTKEKGDKAL